MTDSIDEAEKTVDSASQVSKTTKAYTDADTIAEYAQCFDENYYESGLILAQSSRKGSGLQDSSKILTHCGMPIPFFNNYFILNPEVEPEFEGPEAKEFFQDDRLHWQSVVPERWLPRFEASMLENGFTDGGLLPAMIFDSKINTLLAPAVYADLEIRVVEDDVTHSDFVKVAAPAFGIPDFVAERIVTRAFTSNPEHTFYIGYLDGEPVSTSMLFISHGIAGIYWVATAEDHRGKRFGEALTYHATQMGLQQVERFASLQASELGAPVYERMGYQIAYHYKKFTRIVESSDG